jgi:hypothetical protein
MERKKVNSMACVNFFYIKNNKTFVERDFDNETESE